MATLKSLLEDRKWLGNIQPESPVTLKEVDFRGGFVESVFTFNDSGETRTLVLYHDNFVPSLKEKNQRLNEDDPLVQKFIAAVEKSGISIPSLPLNRATDHAQASARKAAQEIYGTFLASNAVPPLTQSKQPETEPFAATLRKTKPTATPALDIESFIDENPQLLRIIAAQSPIELVGVDFSSGNPKSLLKWRDAGAEHIVSLTNNAFSSSSSLKMERWEEEKGNAPELLQKFVETLQKEGVAINDLPLNKTINGNKSQEVQQAVEEIYGFDLTKEHIKKSLETRGAYTISQRQETEFTETELQTDRKFAYYMMGALEIGQLGSFLKNSVK